MKQPSPLAMVVRPAHAGDRMGLRDLAHALAHGPLLSRYGADPSRLGDELCTLADSDRSSETLLIAVEPGSASTAICGVARFSHSGMFGSFGGYLKLIAVADSQQGKGVGSLLLAQVEQAVAAHSRDLFLLASHFNDAAHRFYDRHGYREIGQLPDYVRPEITELIFWKRLRHQ